MHYACQLGVSGILILLIIILDIITELLNGGFDINQKDHYGRTALHWAALMLDLDLFLLLIKHGADYHIRSLVVSASNDSLDW